MTDPWKRPDWDTMSAEAIRARLEFITRPEACSLPELPTSIVQRDVPWLLERLSTLERERDEAVSDCTWASNAACALAFDHGRLLEEMREVQVRLSGLAGYLSNSDVSLALDLLLIGAGLVPRLRPP